MLIFEIFQRREPYKVCFSALPWIGGGDTVMSDSDSAVDKKSGYDDS